MVRKDLRALLLDMFECWFHGLNVCLLQSVRGRNTPPASYRACHLRQYGGRIPDLQAEILYDIHEGIDAGTSVGEVNGRTELLRAGSRIRIQVKSRRQHPRAGPLVQETMVSEMIIGVGDQDREGYAPPELAQVGGCGRRPFLDHFRNLQVATLVTVTGLKHGHRAGVTNPDRPPAVKAIHD